MLEGQTNSELHAELHAKLRPSFGFGGRITRGRLEGALAAAEVVHIGCHIAADVFPLREAVLSLTSVLTHILKRLRLGAVNDEGIGEIVHRDVLENESGGESSEPQGRCWSWGLSRA